MPTLVLARSRYAAALSFIVLAVLSRGAARAPAQLPPSTTAKAKQILVMVRADLGDTEHLGAGIIFARERDRIYIATASHVVQSSNVVRGVFVAFHSTPKRWLPAIVGAHAEGDYDVAVLTVTDAAAAAEPLQFDVLAADDLSTMVMPPVGYPWGHPGGEPWTTSGPENLLRLDAMRILFTAKGVVPGHSGGMLLNANGDLLGMLQRGGSPFGTALRSDVLVRWLASQRYPVELQKDLALKQAAPVGMRRVQFYRDYLSTIFGDRQYLGEVNPTVRGHVYSVTSDDRGRVTKVVVLRDGQTLREYQYRYAGDARLPQFEDWISSGRALSTTSIERNAQGYRVRENFLREDGSQSGYRTYRYGDKDVEISDYTAGNDRPTKTVREFATTGLMKTERSFTADGSYYETTYDPSSGRQVLRTKVTGWNVSVIYRPTYDSDGDIIREDFFNQDNVWFGYNGYDNGLLVLKHYKFTTGFTRDVVIVYDVSRRAREAKFSINGTQICTFRAEWDPSGRFIRTLAISPSGELWAEYPGSWVNEVYKNGNALDGTRTIFHRKGDWW
jgi:Trypsin-like peptidase domain